MYAIDTTNKKIVFSYSKTALFEELKMISALKAQQAVSKDGTDISDMFIITDGEEPYFSHWIDATLPYITSALPQQHLTTSVGAETVSITAFTDTARSISEGNILSADGILKNLLLFGCLAEWYSSVSQVDFQQEYTTKMGENIRLFAEILFDSRKRKVSSVFAVTAGDAKKATTYAEQIAALQTLVAALQIVVNSQGTTLAGHTVTLGEHTVELAGDANSISGLTTDLANEVSRAQAAESGILAQVAEWMADDNASLKIRVNGADIVTYTPEGENQIANISVPTHVTDLSDGGSYPTTATVNSLISAAIVAFAGGNSTLATILADYATKAWVENNFSGGGSGAYVDLVSNQVIAGLKTFADIAVTGTMAIPKTAPLNPVAGSYYLYVDENGNYAGGGDSGSGDEGSGSD